jgi:membrane protein YdbS with pleckstrin-like domain
MHEKQDKKRELAFRWLSAIVCTLFACAIGVLWYAAYSSTMEDKRARAIGVVTAIIVSFALNATSLIVYKYKRWQWTRSPKPVR